MLRTRYSLVTMATLGMLPFGHVAAETETGQFALRGIGAEQCQQVTARLASANGPLAREFLAAWSAGYLSRANRTSPGRFDVMPVVDVRVFADMIGLVCRNNPEASVEAVVDGLVRTMGSLGPRGPSETLQISEGDLTIQIAADVLQQAQQRLIDLKLLPDGSADGKFGPQSRTALREFQKQNGLQQSGLPDIASLAKLASMRGGN